MLGIDSFLDSEQFNETDFIRMAKEERSVTDATLIRYLSKGIAFPLNSKFRPKAKTVETLLQHGARPWLIANGDWNILFAEDVRIALPKPFRSSLNLAITLGDVSIVDILLKYGDVPNSYTYKLVSAPKIAKLLTGTRVYPNTTDFDYLLNKLKDTAREFKSEVIEVLQVYLESNLSIESSSVDRFLDLYQAQ
ncbi:MAG: hypothetical protein VX777_06070 [Chlamydiota bacterium]|nr:hypothetical protein [Chlamydiota bacterium]